MPCPDNGAMTVADTSLTPTRRSAAPVPRLASGRGARAAGPGARRMPGVTRGGWPALVTCMLLTLSLALLAPSAAALEILNLGESGSRYPLGASFEILEDANHEMDIGELVRGGGDSGFEASQQAVPNFGFTQSTIWFRVQLRNESATRRWLLHTSYPLIDDMTVYLVGPEGLRSTHFAGEVLPSKQGEGDAPRYTVELDLGGEDAITLYVRTRTANAHMVPLTLWKPTAFIAYTNGVRFLLGIYFGVAVAMLIYNLMLYLSVRDTAYLYYVGFIFCFAVLMLSVNGLATEYLWPGSLWWSDRVIPLSIAFTVMTGIQFTRRLLETHANLNTGDLLLRSLLLLGLLFVPLSLLLGMGPAVSIAAGLGLSAALALFGCAWASWRAGVTVAPLYLLAWVAFLLGCIAYALLAFGVLPANFLTEYSIQIGSAMEVLLLSFVLAYRIKLLKEENERVQREATETLETRVIDRTEELNLALAQLSAANEQLALLSEEDKLTGAKNHHYFDAHFDEAWRNAERGGNAMSLLLIDIDHFKHINDRHGHLVGDQVLREVAAAVRAVLARSTDVLVRFGGEEFIVMLPHAEIDGAFEVAQRVKAHIEQVSMHSTGEQLSVRVSIGVASTRPAPGAEPLQLIEQADAALYRAKQTGRNRIVIFEQASLVVEHDATQTASHA